MNEKKCNGYERMYTFLSEEDFFKHLEICDSCRQEHERMKKVSELVQEAKPYIKRKRKKLTRLKAACIASVLIFAGLSYPLYTVGSNMYVAYNQENILTAEEMGFPVDEYGFIYIN